MKRYSNTDPRYLQVKGKHCSAVESMSQLYFRFGLDNLNHNFRIQTLTFRNLQLYLSVNSSSASIYIYIYIYQGIYLSLCPLETGLYDNLAHSSSRNAKHSLKFDAPQTAVR